MSGTAAADTGGSRVTALLEFLFAIILPAGVWFVTLNAIDPVGTWSDHFAFTQGLGWALPLYAAYVALIVIVAFLPGAVVVLVPYLWSIAFFLIPFLIVVRISLSMVEMGQPPYSPVFDTLASLPAKLRELSLDNYEYFFSNALYWRAYLSSVWIAFVSTLVTLLVGYPIAYAMARARRSLRPILLMAVILPFWTSFLIRVYAWIGILKPEGLLNQLLLSLGVIDQPLLITNTNWAVYIGIVYSYLPFMVLPLYATLEKLDHTLLEAAADLGSPPLKSFWRITFPLSLPGVVAGSMLVFIPAVGEFVIPDLLGGSSTLMIGKTLWDEFFHNRDWPMASTVAVVLLFVIVVPIVFFQNAQARVRGGPMKRFSAFNLASIVLGFAFLYLPILILVIFSFNASRLVTVWGGFSTQWYVSLWHNQQMLDAAWVTIRVAFLSASIATVLGTMAAVTLVRKGRFVGRTLFTGMVMAPLVMPEVITGLSLLLLFVAIDFDRGFWTVTLAHVSFAMCFVAVVVQSRLVTFDRSLEEAALDLGATPAKAFFLVTLPVIFPAVAAGWMLAFTLSLDDLVIASFTTGPGATTLPMRIYSQVRLGVTPEINAISTLMIAVVTLGVIVTSIATKTRAAAEN